MQLIEHSFISQLSENLSVSRQSIQLDSTITQIVQDVPEMCAIPVDENCPIILHSDIMATTKHGCKHGLGISCQGQSRCGKVHTPNIQLDPTLPDWTYFNLRLSRCKWVKLFFSPIRLRR